MTTSSTSARYFRNRRVSLASVAFGIFCFWWIVKYSFCDSSVVSLRSSNNMSTASSVAAPFSLLVTLQFQDDASLQIFLEAIRPVAKHVLENEPDTLAYEVLLSDKDPLQVLVLERYRDKENAYLKVHKSSEPFLQFRPVLGQMQQDGKVTISGHSYIDAQIGFGDRVGS